METFWAAVVSIFLVGGIIGSLGGAWVADKMGRCVMLLIKNATDEFKCMYLMF